MSLKYHVIGLAIYSVFHIILEYYAMYTIKNTPPNQQQTRQLCWDAH